MDTARDDTIELDDHPELAALTEHLTASGRPCRITRHGKGVARIVPENAGTTPAVDIRGPDWKPDREAFERAAGAWADVDIDAFKKYIYEARKAGTSRRPPPQF